ncbi:exo-alpha-sialidase [Aquimarina sp. U1-2]|uniref:sialidase family protein n=1 Tax=Aquimarina sp. U1-2 TaxID=2823141 RepID=UPI001AEC9B19|nr:sialidase family protein [Aquimarina sp. U1-2]MBP2832872.1 exo-alpha-sialidase [Aquimarina sp. U1-2]
MKQFVRLFFVLFNIACQKQNKFLVQSSIVVCIIFVLLCGCRSKGKEASLSNSTTKKIDYSWLDSLPHKEGLYFTKKERLIYENADPDHLVLKRISVADSTMVIAEADALGYGVSCFINDVIIVAHYARACHWGCREKYTTGTSRVVVRRSSDYGNTWSNPYRLDVDIGGLPGKESAIGWGLAFCKVKDTVYLASARGLFYSYDQGKNWKLRKSGLRKGPKGNITTGIGNGKLHIGPRMFYSTKAGFLLFGQPEAIQEGKLFVWNSVDYGKSWKQEIINTGNPVVTPVEPTAIQFEDNTLFFLSRNGKNGQGSNPSQFLFHVNGSGDYEIQYPKISNCKVTGHQDTHDVIYNPKTDQFEATISDRCYDHSDYSKMALTLWTIPKKDALLGKNVWKYIGDYFPPISYGSGAEGTHPGGSVIDVKRNKQYLQVHRGKGHAISSSLYHLERTLNTDVLKEVLHKSAQQ